MMETLSSERFCLFRERFYFRENGKIFVTIQAFSAPSKARLSQSEEESDPVSPGKTRESSVASAEVTKSAKRTQKDGGPQCISVKG